MHCGRMRRSVACPCSLMDSRLTEMRRRRKEVRATAIASKLAAGPQIESVFWCVGHRMRYIGSAFWLKPSCLRSLQNRVAFGRCTFHAQAQGVNTESKKYDTHRSVRENRMQDSIVCGRSRPEKCRACCIGRNRHELSESGPTSVKTPPGVLDAQPMLASVGPLFMNIF